MGLLKLRIEVKVWELKRRVKGCWNLLVKGESKIMVGEDSYYVEVIEKGGKLKVLEELCGLMDSLIRIYEMEGKDFDLEELKKRMKLVEEGDFEREDRKKLVKKYGFR